MGEMHCLAVSVHPESSPPRLSALLSSLDPENGQPLLSHILWAIQTVGRTKEKQREYAGRTWR